MENKQESKSPIFYTRLIGIVDDKSIKEVMKDIDMANATEYVKEIVLTISSGGGWLY